MAKIASQNGDFEGFSILGIRVFAHKKIKKPRENDFFQKFSKGAQKRFK